MEQNLGNFIGKAKLYSKYRPNYSDNYFKYLHNNLKINNKSVVADVGAGTGIHTKGLLSITKRIYAIEPDTNMLSECILLLKDYTSVRGINCTAENINLPANSVDYITVAQAFHLFNQKKCIKEFRRILRPNGKLILVWNSKEHNALFYDSEKIIKKYCPCYSREIHARTFTKTLYQNCFTSGTYSFIRFYHDSTELLDKETFIMRTMSASYAITPENINYNSMVNELENVFDFYAYNQHVEVPESTVIYHGNIK